MTRTRTNPPRGPLGHSLLAAALCLALPAALVFLAPDHLNAERAQRALGVVMAVVLVVYANAAPKTLTPLSRMRRDPAAEQAARRFAAWSLTLGGVGYALAWMVVPVDGADVVAVSLLGTSWLLALVRCVRVAARGAGRSGV